MNVVIVQPDIVWESPLENIENSGRLLRNIRSEPDLILFPEMFTTGFSMHTELLAEQPENHIIRWMKEKAELFNAGIAGSLIITEGGKYFNRLVFVDETGNEHFYDKRHMFRMGGEGDHFEAGKKRLLLTYRNWRICPLICYDLRFPVWSRNRDEYDLLLYLSNWPAARSRIWNTLLRARAIENQCWVIGVNRVGKDGENIDYIGESQVIDPKGNVVKKLADKEEVAEFNISLEELISFRKKFPVWKDRDSFIADW